MEEGYLVGVRRSQGLIEGVCVVSGTGRRHPTSNVCLNLRWKITPSNLRWKITEYDEGGKSKE